VSRHHGRIGRQIMLDADRQIAARGENVRQKRVFGEFDGVAMVEDRTGSAFHCQECVRSGDPDAPTGVSGHGVSAVLTPRRYGTL